MGVLPAINLRTASTFTLLRSSLTTGEIADITKGNGQPAVGMIDRGSLAGTYSFAKAARKAGIQGIVGADFASALGDVTLIAMNAQGWRNLLALRNAAASTPTGELATSSIADHCEGLALLTGRAGSVLDPDNRSDKTAVQAWMDSMQGAFAERTFIEIDRANGRQASEAALDRISRDRGIPLIGTCSAACASPDHRWSLDLLASIDQKRTIEDDRLVRPGPGQHMRGQDALRETFADAPQLLENAARFALLCEADAVPSSRKPLLPHYPDARGDEPGMLRTKALQGYMERLKGVAREQQAAYWDRLNSELEIICAQGFAGYFLIVADFIGWSKRNGIPVGPGRGSGAGSAVAWALGITDLDPIRWGLLFERFINPDRVSLPDFDVDFCQTRREETIGYVREKYGHDRVVAIGTHGTWGARSAFRDTARALAIPGGAANAAAEMLPDKGGFSLSARNPEEPGYLSPEVLEHFRSSSSLMRALEMAEPLQGYIRQHGRHAAGIIIADDPVASLVPVMRDPGGGDDFVTEYEMKEVEESGLVKFDFLGLKTSTIIAEAANHVRALPDGKKDLDVLAIPFDDDAVFSLLNAGSVQGVFQLESEGMVKALKQVKPSSFEDLIALISLYRPGPMENIPAFANRKAGIEPIQLPHPSLAPVLEETMGIIVYQEQVMQSARLLAGYTLAEADLLRRAMGKKIQSEMDAQRARFIEGAKENGIPPQRAGELFALIDRFAGYGFNKSHAAAYALLTWQSAWLKQHYPAAFYAAALTYSDGDFGRIRQIMREAKTRGITFLPPHVCKSRVSFQPETIEGQTKAVRWGFSGVKGLGSYGRILEARCHGKTYQSLAQLAGDLAAAGQATTQIRALAACGALDELEPERNVAAEHLTQCLRFHTSQDGAGSLLFELDPPGRPKLERQSLEERRADELAAMGLSFDEHPLAEATHLRRLAGAQSLRYIEDLAGCGAVTILARVDKATKAPRASQFCVHLSDGTADIEAWTETAPEEGIIVRAEVARKATENKWRLIGYDPCELEALPVRLSLELAPTHDWEAIREILVSEGRGSDRVDIIVNLGERKHRRVVPSCFNVTQHIVSTLSERTDVLSASLERANFA